VRVVDVELHAAEETPDTVLRHDFTVDVALHLVILDTPAHRDLGEVFVPSRLLALVRVVKFDRNLGFNNPRITALVN